MCGIAWTRLGRDTHRDYPAITWQCSRKFEQLLLVTGRAQKNLLELVLTTHYYSPSFFFFFFCFFLFLPLHFIVLHRQSSPFKFPTPFTFFKLPKHRKKDIIPAKFRSWLLPPTPSTSLLRCGRRRTAPAAAAKEE